MQESRTHISTQHRRSDKSAGRADVELAAIRILPPETHQRLLVRPSCQADAMVLCRPTPGGAPRGVYEGFAGAAFQQICEASFANWKTKQINVVWILFLPSKIQGHGVIKRHLDCSTHGRQQTHRANRPWHTSPIWSPPSPARATSLRMEGTGRSETSRVHEKPPVCSKTSFWKWRGRGRVKG